MADDRDSSERWGLMRDPSGDFTIVPFEIFEDAFIAEVSPSDFFPDDRIDAVSAHGGSYDEIMALKNLAEGVDIDDNFKKIPAELFLSHLSHYGGRQFGTPSVSKQLGEKSALALRSCIQTGCDEFLIKYAFADGYINASLGRFEDYDKKSFVETLMNDQNLTEAEISVLRTHILEGIELADLKAIIEGSVPLIPKDIDGAVDLGADLNSTFSDNSSTPKRISITRDQLSALFGAMVRSDNNGSRDVDPVSLDDEGSDFELGADFLRAMNAQIDDSATKEMIRLNGADTIEPDDVKATIVLPQSKF